MSFEELKARVSLLMEEATHQPEDLHEALEILREQIAEMRSLNGEVPSDLLRLEQRLNEKLNLN